jgi:hypothetical protein
VTVARLLLALALASCPAAAAAAAAVPDAGSARPPARLLVSAKEYSLTLSRARVVRGGAVIQLLNRGEDEHDLRLRRISSASRPTARWRVTAPGDVSELQLRLSRGRYRLWCSLSGHSALGMRTTLRVVRPR